MIAVILFKLLQVFLDYGLLPEHWSKLSGAWHGATLAAERAP